MQCPNCQAALDEDTIFCGNCGQQIAPLRAQGATMTYPGEKSAGQEMTTLSRARPPAPPSFVRGRSETPPPTILPTPPAVPRRGRPGLLLSAIILLVLLASGTVLAIGLLRHQQVTNGNGPASGQVVFFDGTNGSDGTDALRITITGLPAAPAGTHYHAWLIDESSEHTTSLGPLNAQGSSFILNFTGNGGNGQPGTNLLGLGNLVEVTQEQGNVQQPSGKVLLAARFPPQAFVHIRHLLFSFPTTPAKIGLLVGMVEQTRLLNAQSQALQSIASTQNTAAIQCLAQSIIDISEGLKGPHYQPLAEACGASLPAGDGFGILGANGYAETAATHAALAASQADATTTVRQHAGEVEVGTTNITGWVTTIDRDALALLSNPHTPNAISEIVTLADHAFHGVDSNGNGQVEPIANEEGATTAYQRGQLMATLALLPAAK